MPLPNALRIIATITALLFTVLFSAVVCFGCDCLDLSPPESFRAADLVFVGSAAAVTDSGSDRNVTFRVEQVLKGTPTGPVVITSHMSDCDRSFQTGNAYVVYARQSGAQLIAPTCLSTHVLPGLVAQQPIIRYTSSPRYGYRATVAGVILLLALAVGYIVGRASKRAA